MIKIVNKELVNKLNEVKALSLALRPCHKLLQVHNYSTTHKEASYYTSEILSVDDEVHLSRLKTHTLRKNVSFPVIYLIFLLCLRMSGVVFQRRKWCFLPPDLLET